MMTQFEFRSQMKRRTRTAMSSAAMLAAILMLTGWIASASADCEYPDIVRILAAAPSSEGLDLALLPAGTTSKDFAGAVANALSVLRRTDPALIHRVDLESSENGVSVERKFADDQNKYDVFIVIDSEFMLGQYPKYNAILDYYKNTTLEPDVIMIFDRYLLRHNTAAFAQVTAKYGAEGVALLVEIAAANVAHPGLMESEPFLKYEGLVADYVAMSRNNPKRPSDEAVGKARQEVITDCVGASGRD
jgi:hypothetical protein